MSDATFHVLLRMELHPGAGPQFEAVWTEIGDQITGHWANRGQSLRRDTENPDVYYVQSHWVDEPGFREFEHSDEHVVHRQRLHPYRVSGAMWTMSTVVDLPAQGAPVGSMSTLEPETDPGRVRVLLRCRTDENDADGLSDIHAAYRAISAQLAGTPGLLGNELLQSTLEDDRFAVLSEWADLGAFRAWEAGPSHRGTTSPLRRFQDRDNGIRHYDIYEVLDFFVVSSHSAPREDLLPTAV